MGCSPGGSGPSSAHYFAVESCRNYMAVSLLSPGVRSSAVWLGLSLPR